MIGAHNKLLILSHHLLHQLFLDSTITPEHEGVKKTNPLSIHDVISHIQMSSQQDGSTLPRSALMLELPLPSDPISIDYINTADEPLFACAFSKVDCVEGERGREGRGRVGGEGGNGKAREEEGEGEGEEEGEGD